MYRIMLALLWLIPTSLLAKDLNLLPNFSSENPLSYQFIRSITQDQQGFMWFGTQEGLHRYDGYQFVSFHHDSADPNSLGADVISRVFVDSRGRLWTATRGGGINLFINEKQGFFKFQESSDFAIAHNNVNALLEDSQGKIWAGTEKGISIISGEQNQWQIKHLEHKLDKFNGLKHNVVHTILQVGVNEIWVGTLGGGISAFNLQGDFIKHVELTYQDKPLLLINTLYKDKDNNVWVGTVDLGLHKYNLSSTDIDHFVFNSDDKTSITSNTIEAIIQDSSGQIWVASDKGLMIYNKDNGSFWQYHHLASNPNSLKNDFILTLFEDDEQLMWIGTLSGVNRWDPKLTTFTQFNAQKYPELQNSTVTDFTVYNEENVLFSTYSGGIYQLSKSENLIKPVTLPRELSDLRIMSILYENQHLWIGTRSSGLYYLDLELLSFKHYQHVKGDSTSLSANSVTDIVKSGAGDIWVATFHNGINKLIDEKFKRFVKQDATPKLGPSSNHVMRIVEDSYGMFWLATYGGGLNRFSPAHETFRHIQHDEEDANTISSDLAWLVFIDAKENIWVGTQAAGLNMLSLTEQQGDSFKFTRMNLIDGMKSRTVYGIAQDQQSGIWISTNKGISRYDFSTENFKHFGLSHGLTELEFNHGAYFTDESNTLYFGSANGVTRVDPDKINQSHAAPKIRLIGVSRLNKPITFEQPLNLVKKVSFAHTDQLISFEYVGLNYSDPYTTEYEYKLQGFDEQWINAGKSRKANYTNLPSGEYELIVKAKNSDNVWSEPTPLIKVSIAPAPWNTWWAYTIYVVLIAIALLTYSRAINRKLVIEKLRQQELERQVVEKTKEFAEKNEQLEAANNQLENLAIKDKLTNAKSRRYMDIYIEQASQLLTQIHGNLLPVHRGVLPRLYVVLIDLSSTQEVKAHHLLDCVELLKYTGNKNDIVVRLSDHVFAIIGSESEQKAAELSERIASRASAIDITITVTVAYGFFPFDIENPAAIEWDKINVILEHLIFLMKKSGRYSWLGVSGYKSEALSMIKILQSQTIEELEQQLHLVKPTNLTIN